MLKDLIYKLFRHQHFVIADARDNSMTISKKLYKHLEVEKLERAKVFCFYIPNTKEYGFALNPNIEQETQMSDIQYNGKCKTIGFECLNPSVNRIFYDYGLPANKAVKLSVEECLTADKSVRYYKLLKPLRNG